MFEEVACYYCGSTSSTFVLNAEEDLTGKPGTFRFVKCDHCGLMYQNPGSILRPFRASTTTSISPTGRKPIGAF